MNPIQSAQCDANEMTPDAYALCRKQELLAKKMREQESQSSMGGMNPAMIQQFMGGEAAAGEAAAGASAGGGSAGSSAGGAAAAGGGEGAGMMAAAGPYAAIAAAIIANETYANKKGRRPDKFKDQVKEGITGESYERDMKNIGQWVDKRGGKLGEIVGNNIEDMGKINPSNLPKAMKPWEWEWPF